MADGLGIEATEMILYIITAILVAVLSLYIKDYLQNILEFGKFKKKIESVAGKSAQILYEHPDFGQTLFRIEKIDSMGLTLKRDLYTIFIPRNMVLEEPIIKPTQIEKFDEKRAEGMKAYMEENLDAFLPLLTEKIMPTMMDSIKEHLMKEFEEDGEFDAAMMIRIRKALKDEGFEPKALTGATE